MLEWMAMPSSRGSSWSQDQTWVSYVSCFGRWALYHWCHLGSPSVIMGGRHIQIPPTNSQWGWGAGQPWLSLASQWCLSPVRGTVAARVPAMVTQLDDNWKIHSENPHSMSKHISLPVSISCRSHDPKWPAIEGHRLEGTGCAPSLLDMDLIDWEPKEEIAVNQINLPNIS